jgi:hypothetical protein
VLHEPVSEGGLHGGSEKVDVLNGLELLDSIWWEQADGERDDRLALSQD